MAKAYLPRAIALAVAGFALVLMAVLPATPGKAQTQRQLNWCLNKSESIAPRLRIEGCTAAIQSDRRPENLYSAYYNRGIAYFRTGQYESAIADFDQAVRLDSRSAFAFNNRGMALARVGQYDKAIDDFDQAIALEPGYTIIFNNRGSAYAKKGQFDRAIADFDRALQLDPKDRNARSNRKLAERMRGTVARANADAPSVARDRSLTDRARISAIETDASDARKLDNPSRENPPKADAAPRDRHIVATPKSGGSDGVNAGSRPPVQAARPRRGKPQNALARFFRQQQTNLGKMLRAISPRRSASTQSRVNASPVY
jgi:tetratricopeptide (TPR) repeat protein